MDPHSIVIRLKAIMRFTSELKPTNVEIQDPTLYPFCPDHNWLEQLLAYSSSHRDIKYIAKRVELWMTRKGVNVVYKFYPNFSPSSLFVSPPPARLARSQLTERRRAPCLLSGDKHHDYRDSRSHASSTLFAQIVLNEISWSPLAHQHVR